MDPLRKDFEKAADQLREWRERQKAALGAAERGQYEHLAQALEKRRQESIRRFWNERFDRIEREKRAILLPKPDAALRMGPQKPVRESRAEFLAQEIVHRRHKKELEEMEAEAQRHLDGFLREAEIRRGGVSRVFRSIQRGRDRGDDGRER